MNNPEAFPSICRSSAPLSRAKLSNRSLLAIACAAASIFIVNSGASAQSGWARSTSALSAAPAPEAGSERLDAPANPLPDAPQPAGLYSSVSTSTAISSSSTADPAGGADTVHGNKMAGPYTKYIEPGEQVPHLTARDKVILGLKDAVSPFSWSAWVASSAYEQVFNNSPNYGQTGRGYAQRLGAAAARDFTEGTFSDSFLAPVLHEDPRYYRLGKSHAFFKRVVYAGTRGLITRTDSGHATPNFANVGGNFFGSLLTDAYYPARNTTFSETMETFGTGVGGSAFGFVVTEFLPDVFHYFHLPAPGY